MPACAAACRPIASSRAGPGRWSGAAPICARRPEAAAPLDSQLLAGETVTLFGERDGWAWVQSRRDNYVGYLEAAALSDEVHPPTHVVAALRSFVYPAPDLKRPPLDVLSFAAEASVVEERDGYCRIAAGGWIYSRHLAPAGLTCRDHVATALRFLGVPYLWGGRSSLGLDCSALVQLALAQAGIPLPRDADQQEAAAAGALAGSERSARPRRPSFRPRPRRHRPRSLAGGARQCPPHGGHHRAGQRPGGPAARRKRPWLHRLPQAAF